MSADGNHLAAVRGPEILPAEEGPPADQRGSHPSTPDPALRILVIEDEASDFIPLEGCLRQHGLAAQCCKVATPAALAAALEFRWDVVLCGDDVPAMDLLASLRELRSRQSDLPVILVAGTIGDEAAAELLRLGLEDFVLKDRLAHLPGAIRRAIDRPDTRFARRDADMDLPNAPARSAHETRQGRQTARTLMEEAELVRERVDAAHAALLDAEARYGLLAHVDDVRDLSQIEAGRPELDVTDFDLGDLLANVRASIADLAEKKGIAVAVEIEGLPRWLRGDAPHLRQALLNFAGNALKFTRDGRITLRARLERVEADNFRVRFEVEDTGVGIAPESLPGLFAQADSSITRKFGGTRLGLPSTRRLAELMRGEAGAQSAPGEGSLFWFTAQLARGEGRNAASSPPSAASPAAELAHQYPGARILLAEDNEINREVALEILRAADVAVDIAVDGREAVAQARGRAYDLILMDVQMPGLDGIGATRDIRQLPGREKVPIVAMTASSVEEDKHVCLAAGMNDFVSKPVDPDVLYRLMLKWLTLGVVAHPPAEDCREPTDGNARRQALARIDGLDVGQGMKMSGGRLDPYVNLLELFLDTHGDDPHRLRELARAADLAGIERLAHTLKGSGWYVGAMGLVESTEQIGSAIRSRRDEAFPQALKLADELDALLLALRRALHG